MARTDHRDPALLQRRRRNCASASRARTGSRLGLVPREKLERSSLGCRLGRERVVQAGPCPRRHGRACSRASAISCALSARSRRPRPASRPPGSVRPTSPLEPRCPPFLGGLCCVPREKLTQKLLVVAWPCISTASASGPPALPPRSRRTGRSRRPGARTRDSGLPSRAHIRTGRRQPRRWSRSHLGSTCGDLRVGQEALVEAGDVVPLSAMTYCCCTDGRARQPVSRPEDDSQLEPGASSAVFASSSHSTVRRPTRPPHADGPELRGRAPSRRHFAMHARALRLDPGRRRRREGARSRGRP